MTTVFTIETVGGTPVLTAQGSPVWRPRVRRDGPVQRISSTSAWVTTRATW
jgi:hypothetical protein